VYVPVIDLDVKLIDEVDTPNAEPKDATVAVKLAEYPVDPTKFDENAVNGTPLINDVDPVPINVM